MTRMTTRSFRRLLLLTACPIAVAAGAAPAMAQSVITQSAPAQPPAAQVDPNGGRATSASAPAATRARQAHTVGQQQGGQQQGGSSAAANAGESVIVTGTRSLGRKARDSTSPIDVVTAATLRRSGQLNLSDALTKTDPSIGVNAMGADTADLTAAIVLRGLNPDDTLVLIDGKRRNGTANISADAGPQQGATPVDVNMIPAAAIDHIEVLRDGAAAQYGSDAVAGVVNIIMKKTDHGTSGSATTGADAYNGDGWQYQLNADQGASFGDDGYVHIGGQMYHTDHFTSPAIDDRTGTDVNHINGLPEETRETLSLDFGKTLFEGVQGYGLITYGHRHAEGYENYRLPTVLPEVFPVGFGPLETDEENEYAATLGLKGDDFFGFRWDVSSTYGADELDIGNKNTSNPVFYTTYGYTPTKSLAQSMRNAQWTNDIDFSRPLSLLSIPFNLAFGAEERVEDYKLGAGNPVSYLFGGTQGFGGLLPQNAGSWNRDVWAGYIDADIHPLPQWDVDLAGRFEHYTDSGNDEIGKLSSRYDFTRKFAVRGTISTGFRAPTLAEEHFSALNVSPTGASGDIAVDSAAARAIGAVPLKPERSTNVSGGIVVEPVSDLSVTLDLYQINIRDRIIAGGDYSGNAAATAIELTGATLPADIGTNDLSAYYFSNGASTRTQGADLNVNYLTRFGEYGTVDWTAALDLNRTRIHHVGVDTNGNPLLNAEGIGYLTTAFPRSKLILNAFWRVQKWDVNLRWTRWGETTNDLQYEDTGPPALQFSTSQFYQFKNEPRWLTDLEVGYNITPHWHAAIGGNNLFNIRPQRTPQDIALYGVQYYDQNSDQVPINGGFYYGRLNFSF
nr:TonB-dependent receptor [uncultured Lichenicoccus sp.]